MTEICRPGKCIEAIRVALLDQCTLLPVCGPLNGYAMGCVIDPSWSPEIEEGDESTVKDDCGNICLYDQRCDIVKRWNLEFKISRPDPEFIALIGGDNLIVNAGVSVGAQHLAQHCSPWLYVELFERTDGCTDGTPVYYRHVFPAARLTWTGNEKEGIFRILQIEGKTQQVLLDNVGVGPFEDVPAYAIVAPPGSRTDYFWFEDTTLPTVQCGAIEVPCPTPCDCEVTGQSSPECERLVITGTCFGNVNHIHTDFGEYYDPTGPDAGLNPVGSTINVWNSTTIDITDPNFGGGTSSCMTLLDENDVTICGPFCPGDVTIDACATFEITGATSEECDTICITGTGLLSIDQLQFANDDDFPTFWNPAGPNAGNNPGGAIISWTDTEVCITDPSLSAGAQPFTGVNPFDENGDELCSPSTTEGCIPFNPDVTVEPCEAPFAPELGDATAECYTISLNGDNFDQVNHIQIGAIVGADKTYYDPDGPDAGLNPSPIEIITWDNNDIVIWDPSFTPGYTVGAVHMWSVGDTDDVDFNVPDFEVPVLTITNVTSPECDRLVIEGTCFDVIDQIIPDVPGSGGFNWYNPDVDGPGPFTVNEWSDTVIDITDPRWESEEVTTYDVCGLLATIDNPIHNHDYGPIAFPDGCVTVTPCPPVPLVTDAESNECETFDIIGENFDLVNHILPNGGFPDLYDPAGPDAGLNPGNATINSWTPTLISVTLSGESGNMGSVHLWGVGDVPDYGIQNFPDGILTIDACPTPTVEGAAASDCYTFELDGTNFDAVNRLELNYPGGPGPYYDPAGPDALSNPVTATILAWNPTQIIIEDNPNFVGTVNNVHLWGVGDNPNYGTFGFAEITLFACPLIENGTTENCDEFVLYGTRFDLANHLRIQTTPGGFVDYYDPAGPDAGLNPGTATILSWTPTEIRIVDTALGDTNEALVNAQFWGVGETPEYEVQDLSSFVITDCDDIPGVTGSSSPQCQYFTVSGGRFDLVDHIVVSTDSGTLDYYDPAGPNNGLNPGTAQIVGWTPSAITIYDTQLTDYTVQDIQLFDVGDATDYGIFDVADYLVAACEPPAVITGNDSGVDRFQLHGTGFDSVNHIQVITSGATADYDYFDPNGPNAGFNPGFVTVLSWTDTLIEIQHTGINATITDVHCWGCCGALGDPDYGNFNIPNFVVN